MTTTDVTNMVPLHPFQNDFNLLPDQDIMTKRDTTLSNDMTVKLGSNTFASPPSSTLSSSSSSSSFSSNSSTRASRLSIPTLWNNKAATGDISTMESTFIPSASSVWSYSSNNLLTDSKGIPQQGGRRSSLSHTPLSCTDQSPVYQKEDGKTQYPQYSYFGWNESISSNHHHCKQSLRSIWCAPSIDPQRQQSHQRRMSLSDCWSSLITDTQHNMESNMDQSYGRRHSVAGPFINKPLHGLDGRRSYHDVTNDYPMKAINEDDPFLNFNTCYSRQQQHFLNKGVLEHIDEYFGGKNGHGKNKKSDLHSPSSGNPYSPDSYMDNVYQQGFFSHTTPSNGIPPVTTSSTTYHISSNNNNSFGKTMTAGGDAAIFGCSTVLMGKGIPLRHFLDSNTVLYIVEFKTGRTDICYIMQGDQVTPQVGDLVVIEADRGSDLGKVTSAMTANDIIKNEDQPQRPKYHGRSMSDGVPSTDAKEYPTNETPSDDTQENTDTNIYGDTSDGHFTNTSPLVAPNDKLVNQDSSTEEKEHETAGSQKYYVKRLYRLANSDEKLSLTTKLLDEKKALMVCQAKIKQKELPMRVVDAEYQWDRRKLTFYFLADQRIDFRELVRELFKTYKTRIWMCALKPDSNDGSYENQ